MVLPIFTTSAEDAPDMNDFAENFKKLGEAGKTETDVFNVTTEESHHKYAERMIGVCEDMCALGYI